MLSKYIIYEMKNIVKTDQNNCLLLLEDGSMFPGKGYGKFGDAFGELCFNTSITGYQEILSDPSYFKQIINFTFPHIGIVGSNYIDYESEKIFASGCIINSEITLPSNFRSEMSFDKWLKKEGKICISKIDTRNLTKRIRDKGACNAMIHFPKKEFKSTTYLKDRLKSFPSMKSLDLATEVSTSNVYSFSISEKKIINPFKLKGKFIAVIDYGVKKNILRMIEFKGIQTIIFPVNFSLKDIIRLNPNGIFLSNGPGDPTATYLKYKKELDLLKDFKKPIFGICLGHQILSLIFGAKTEKMHHGHRGANHPIKNLKNKKVEITVQNHGFVVSKKKFPSNLRVTHLSLFDKTIAGFEVKNKPFFSVQYHPESSPGPQDSHYLFEKFKNLVNKYA